MLALTLAVALAAPKPPSALVLHEWGTFTSVAGADGKPISWRPLRTPTDLPSFVHGLGSTLQTLRFPNQGGKGHLSGDVRMETPVIYFYAKEPTEVSLSVGFTKGAITEWYPFAKSFGSTLDWGRFKVLPNSPPQPALLTEAQGSHYYAAREVDAALLQVCGERTTERERFLFYRGVGTFKLPLNLRVDGEGLRFGGHHGDVIVMARSRDQVGVSRVTLSGDEQRVQRPQLTSKAADAEALVLKLLLETGLYEKEAKAMVATWKDSWFEEGLRVFFIVPRSTTDELLPLTVAPAPSEVVRVLVGRIEVLTPEAVNAFRTQLSTIDDLPVGWLDGLRFGEPLLKRALAVASDPAEKRLLQSLLDRWATRAQGTGPID